MHQPQILEGTWDEVNAQLSHRVEELRSYGKLRLIVLREDAPQQVHANGFPVSKPRLEPGVM